MGQEKFDLVTDSKALCALRTASNLAGKLARWSFFLEEFNYNLVHKSGVTLTNADGLSRCATADGHPSDSQIRLDAVASVETDEATLRFNELQTPPSIDGEIMEVNVLAKFIKAAPCSKCDNLIGEAKAKVCGACGEAVHVACLKGKPSVGYWFCKDCAPKFQYGHTDAALNIPLHNLIRGIDYYPGADKG